MRLQEESASFVFLGGGDSEIARGKFCIFRVVNVFIPKLIPEKWFKATKKINKH